MCTSASQSTIVCSVVVSDSYRGALGTFSALSHVSLVCLISVMRCGLEAAGASGGRFVPVALLPDHNKCF